MPKKDLTVLHVPISSLHTDPGNVRLHGERNMEAIVGSLTRFGQVEPLVVHKKTRRVIGGNGRLAAMKKLGWTHANVVELDIDDTQATALAIALNRTAELAEWDQPALFKTLESLLTDGSLEGVGYTEREMQDVLDEMLSSQQVEVNEDDVPTLPDAPTTRMGDLWLLGRHRLLNGDSGDMQSVDALMKGERAHTVCMDPPYNVNAQPRSVAAALAGNTNYQVAVSTEARKEGESKSSPRRTMNKVRKLRAKDRKILNDEILSDEEFGKKLRTWFGNAARILLPGRAFYIWGGYANTRNYPSALEDSGLYFSQAIIWDKMHPVISRKDFMGAHEWCFYGWREGAAHVFLGPANVPDIWHIKKVNHTKMVHLTEKPVELGARALAYSTRPDENVLDLFGGSGSTMIAAEQAKRNAFLMELDPLYCDVIVERYEKFTGKEAMLESTGETYAERKALTKVESSGAENGGQARRRRSSGS